MKITNSLAVIANNLRDAFTADITVILDDILANTKENIFIISAADVTSLNTEKIRNVIKEKEDLKCVIFVYQNEDQRKRLDTLSGIGRDNIYIIGASDSETAVTEINRVMRVYSNKQSMLLGSLDQSIEYQIKPLSDVSLPMNYTPGKLLFGDNEFDIPSIEQMMGKSVTADQKFIETSSGIYSVELGRVVDTPESEPEFLRKKVDSVKVDLQDVNIHQVRKAIDYNTIVNELRQESASYASLRQAMDMLNQEINNIMVDNTIPLSTKVDKIMEYVGSKQETRTKLENIEVKKFLEIMESIKAAMELKVNEIIRKIENKYSDKDVSRLYKENSDELRELLLEKRGEQAELAKIIESLNNTLHVLDKTKIEMLNKFIKKDITSSEMYDNILYPSTGDLHSTDLKEMVSKLTEAASKNEQSYTVLIGRLSKLIESLFSLGEINSRIARKNDFLNRVLVAQRVEETVVIDSITKFALRIVVGRKDSGKTAYSHITTKLKSREVNSCIVDLSPNSNLGKYTQTVNLSDVLAQETLPREDYLAIVQDEVAMSFAKVEKLLDKLATYYKYICVLIPDQDRDSYERLVDRALTVTFIVDDSTASINSMKPYLNGISLPNTAIIIANMFSELNPVELIELYNINTDKMKVVNIPFLTEVRTATRKGRDPLASELVKIAYEGLV